MNEDIIDVIEENVEDIVPVEEETVIVNTGGTTDHARLSHLDYESSGHTGFASSNDLSNEATARQNAVSNLQNQIDAITVSSDVVDIVGTYQDLQNYDTTKLTDDDIIKVMQDSTHSNAMSYYRWNVTNDVGTWVYVGSEGPFYTKSESDTKFQDKLVSGTNIKTINNISILGNGNLIIDPAGGANLIPLEVPNNSMNLYDFINEAEAPETYTISNDNDVAISIEKEAGTDEVWVQKGSIISVYPQYSATILSADGMYIYYVDWESGEYLTGGGAVDYETVVQIVNDTVDTSNLVDLTNAQTITGKKTFKDNGIEFQKTGYNPKSGLEAGTNGLDVTYTDSQGNKSTKLGIDNQYTTTDQDVIPRNNYSYNYMTREYEGTNLGKSDKKFNLIYARALTDGTNTKGLGEILTNNANLIPESSSVYTLGSTNNRWNGLYLYGNIEMSLGYINQVRAITANEYRVKDGNFNNNYYSLLKYAYVSPGKTVAQLQNGIDVNNRVIHNIGTPDDDTSPISKGYADSHYQGTLTAGTGIAITNNVISSTLEGIDYEVDQELPATGEKGIIYLIPNGSSEQENIYDEYIWIPPLQEGESGRFEFIGTTQTDLTNYVDLTSAQTISGNKTFSGTLIAPTIKGASYIEFRNNNGVLATMYNDNIIFNKRVQPNSDNSQDLGTSTKRWKDLYLSGNLSDGTNSVAVNKIANKDNFVTLSQSDYDALATKDPDTFYFIEEE